MVNYWIWDKLDLLIDEPYLISPMTCDRDEHRHSDEMLKVTYYTTRCVSVKPFFKSAWACPPWCITDRWATFHTVHWVGRYISSIYLGVTFKPRFCLPLVTEDPMTLIVGVGVLSPSQIPTLSLLQTWPPDHSPVLVGLPVSEHIGSTFCIAKIGATHW
jgi:hypothetical protein